MKMKIAIYALSKESIATAKRLKEESGEELKLEIFAPLKWQEEDGEIIWHQDKFKDILKDNFKKYDAHVCIMALGIVVRALAPLIQAKMTDPGIVVLDDQGRNVISVLAGHLGGANHLTEEIAQILGANPVVTTASDGLGLLTPDSYCWYQGWKLEGQRNLININSSIVNGEGLDLYLDPELLLDEYVNKTLDEQVNKTFGECIKIPFVLKRGEKELHFENVYPSSAPYGFKPSIVISNRFLAGDLKEAVIIRPANIVVGIGCKKGVSKEEIMDAIHEVFKRFNFSILAIASFASIDIKAAEDGLLKTAEELGVEIDFLSKDEIKNSQLNFRHSEFVEKTVGVGGVCEPAAMIMARTKELLVSKQVLKGITIALAQKKIIL